MPEFVVHHVDEVMAKRIQSLARDRDWTVNEVLLEALRSGLGLNGAVRAAPELDSGASLSTWDTSEEAVFREALDALDQANPVPRMSARGG